MKTKFNKFINEQYYLTIEDSMDDFELPESKWMLEYNVTDLWKKYKKDKNYNEFINKYLKTLTSKKDDLINISEKCWSDLLKIVKDKKDNKIAYLDKIYDWGDKYGIKISVKKTEEK